MAFPRQRILGSYSPGEDLQLSPVTRTEYPTLDCTPFNSQFGDISSHNSGYSQPLPDAIGSPWNKWLLNLAWNCFRRRFSN